MAEKNSIISYRKILKGTAIFGGVQIFNIAVNLIRGKFVAVILGPEGMGISSLFNTASATLQRFSSLGLNLAIVKEVAPGSDSDKISSPAVETAMRLTAITAIIGALICIFLCRPLSKLTFGTPDFSWQFMLLGLAVAFGISGTGKLSILQGLHEVKKISHASIAGSLAGLCFGVPLYYILGDKGIVPAMLAVSLALWISYSISLRKCGFHRNHSFKLKDHLPLIKKLLLLGIILMSNDLIVSLVSYIINLYVRTRGSIDDVGLYQAANTVTSQYSAIVFTIMAMDYFPRLSKSISDNVLMRATVNRQTEITSLLITPAMTLLILSAPLLIKILLAGDFMRILPLMRWMGLGIFFRALAMPMAYISFAKGNKKLFFWLECIFCNLLTLFLSCIFYKYFGLIGLGYALVADNGICLVVYFIINRRFYSFSFNRETSLGMLLAFIATSVCFCAAQINSPFVSYSVMGIIAAVTIATTIILLRKKLRISEKEESINSLSSRED